MENRRQKSRRGGVWLDPGSCSDAFVTDEMVEVVLLGKSVGQWRISIFVGFKSVGCLFRFLRRVGRSGSRQTQQTFGMPPIFTTTSVLFSGETEALEHGSLLLGGIVLFSTGAESTGEVVVVLVLFPGEVSSNGALLAGSGIYSQSAWSRGRESCGSAVALEVALGEELNKVVFSMARDAAGVAESSV